MNITKTEQYVFVYGTLKKGFSNHFFISDCEFICKSKTIDKYQLYPNIDRSFPYLIINEKSQNIYGELYKIEDKEILETLDILEGYPIHYNKKNIEVENIETKEIYNALVYYKNEEFSADIDFLTPLDNWNEIGVS